jgi:hypothetical protein
MRRGRMSAVIDDFRKLEKVLIAEGWTQPPSKEQSSAKSATVSAETQECPVHHAPMKQYNRKDGSGAFWSHITDDMRYQASMGGKRWCHGREPQAKDGAE